MTKGWNRVRLSTAFSYGYSIYHPSISRNPFVGVSMGRVDIELIKGDITERATDGIVNTANNMLILGSGLGGAIKSKGGASIVEECSKYGTIQVGDAVVTKAGKLKSKYIIHAALTQFDGPIIEENIEKSLLSSLRLTKKYKMKSIAIPDMSLGIVRFSPKRCAQIMFAILKKFLDKENRTLKTVEIVVWDIETYRIYKQIYENICKQDSRDST